MQIQEEIAPDRRRRREPTSDDIIDWIERKCYVPDGPRMGQLFQLDQFQCDCIYKIYDKVDGRSKYGRRCRRAIISIGRKNGKTSLAALLLLVHLMGPMARGNSQLYSTAQSRDQAALIYHTAAKIARMSPALRGAVVCRDSKKELFCPGLGTGYRALAAEATTAFGLNPVFVIHDELGQVRGARSTLYEALETATGAQENPLSIIISTQAPNDADLLSILIDDALAENDPSTVLILFTAPMDADPFKPETILLANPALETFLNKREVLAMADDARRMPSREALYRNLVLNQRVEATNPFVAPEIWRGCMASAEALDGVDVYGGLDLSAVADLTALTLIGKRADNKWHVHPTFWLPMEGLADKAKLDRVPYDLWYKQGFLKTTPGKSISYEFVAGYLKREVFDKYKVQKIAFDRWNFRHLQPWLIEVGFNEQFIKDHFVEFGQGMASMSPALRDLEQLLRDKQLAHGDHPVLSMCVSNTVIVTDDAGNRKPSKRKSTGRIDGLVTLAMAVGCAPLKAPVIDVEALIG